MVRNRKFKPFVVGGRRERSRGEREACLESSLSCAGSKRLECSTGSDRAGQGRVG